MSKKKNLERGDIIYYYEITLDFKNNSARKRIEKNEILGINEEMLVLNNSTFKILNLKYKKYSIYSNINNPVAYKLSFSSYYDELIGNIYSSCSEEVKSFAIVKKKL
jgi:hypothetical protein